MKCLWPIYWLIYLLYYINVFVLYFFNWIYTSLNKLLKRIWFEQNVFQNIICENFQIFRHLGSLFALVSSHFSVTKKLWRRFRLTRDSRQQVISKQAEISRRLVNLGKCKKMRCTGKIRTLALSLILKTQCKVKIQARLEPAVILNK